MARSTVGLLVSGGLDSAILLTHLLERGERVQPLYVRSHLAWEEVELGHLQRFLAEVAASALAPLVVLDMPIADVYGEHWSVTGRDVPGAETPDEAVYLPGRNSLLIVKPALWCQLHGIERLALGALGTNPFPDATPEFFEELASALRRATRQPLQIERPFAKLTKRQVMELGRQAPLQHSFSCIAPVGNLHCGQCNKCAERQAAFGAIAAPDPTPYANAAMH